MESAIKTIEDLSLNAWPSHQMQLYDGWILRFSYFYTHRTNSVEQIGASSIPLEEKIQYCEDIYRHWGTPAIFKLSPLVSPSFDTMLEERGYQIQHTTDVMTMQLKKAHLPSVTQNVSITDFIPPNWIDSLFFLKGTTNVMHKMVVPSMYRAIPKDTVCASIQKDGKIVATALGILDRDYIGLYAVHVHPAYRGLGYARSLCTAILKRGLKKGAAHAYLQVVSGNTPAVKLYEHLGFSYFYTYWFRARNLHYISEKE
ncbi:MAG: GNAT family N-acetyltransferase [Lachnospiraceae bacterium]|nr:GNAT family N-acetyltransferase [Lachnospiraceae bacterium]